jgi:hypothetical protein
MLKKILDGIASVPDHIWAMLLVATGAALTVLHQKDTGQSLIAAGLALFKGKQ